MKQINSRIELVSLLPENAVVAEVGVATGRFSKELLESGKVSRLYMIDIWGTIPGAFGDGSKEKEWHNENYELSKKVADSFSGVAVMIKDFSANAANQIPDNSLDGVYLDGDHTHEGNKADLLAYFPKVKSGGFIAGHDYLNIIDYGVNKAVNEFCDGKFEVVVIPEDEPNNASFYFIKK